MPDEDHEELLADAEADADRLEAKTDALGEQVEETRRDFEAKKDDPAAPGIGAGADLD